MDDDPHAAGDLARIRDLADSIAGEFPIVARQIGAYRKRLEAEGFTADESFTMARDYAWVFWRCAHGADVPRLDESEPWPSEVTSSGPRSASAPTSSASNVTPLRP